MAKLRRKATKATLERKLFHFFWRNFQQNSQILKISLKSLLSMNPYKGDKIQRNPWLICNPFSTLMQISDESLINLPFIFRTRWPGPQKKDAQEQDEKQAVAQWQQAQHIISDELWAYGACGLWRSDWRIHGELAEIKIVDLILFLKLLCGDNAKIME